MADQENELLREWGREEEVKAQELNRKKWAFGVQFDRLVRESKKGYRHLPAQFRTAAKDVFSTVVCLEPSEVVDEVLELQRKRADDPFFIAEDRALGRLQDIFVRSYRESAKEGKSQEESDQIAVNELRRNYALRLLKLKLAENKKFSSGISYEDFGANKDIQKTCRLVIEAMKKFKD